MPVEQPAASAPPLPPAPPQNTPHPESAAHSTTPASTARTSDDPLRARKAGTTAATARWLGRARASGASDEDIGSDGSGRRLTRIRKKAQRSSKDGAVVAIESKSQVSTCEATAGDTTLTQHLTPLKYAESENQRGLSACRPSLTVGSLIECVSRNVVDCR